MMFNVCLFKKKLHHYDVYHKQPHKPKTSINEDQDGEKEEGKIH